MNPAVQDLDSAHPAQIVARPGRLLLSWRCLVIGSTVLLYAVPSAVAAMAILVVRGRVAAGRRLYRSLAGLLQRLGPTFVKFGQIMSSRRDALPPALCDELSVLHDSVKPMTERETRRALETAYGTGSDAPFRFEHLTLLASGSIASVFHAAWRGMEVALKLQRPDIAGLMVADLSLLEALVRVAERSPKCQGMPIGDLMAYVSQAILGQLDFTREASNLSRIRASLSPIPGVRVPAVVWEISAPKCLAMEFIGGLDAQNAATLSPAIRRQLAATALMAVRQMVFVEGFVHCDLHPGNLYVTQRGEVVILDAGFSAQLPDRVRQLIGEFFAELSAGRGRRCGEIIIESAVQIRPGTDLECFIRAVAALVDAHAGPGAQPFAMMDFGNALFDLQREFGLYAESDFVFPLMSLAVIESTVRSLSPDLDFKELGRLAGQLECSPQSESEVVRELIH